MKFGLNSSIMYSIFTRYHGRGKGHDKLTIKISTNIMSDAAYGALRVKIIIVSAHFEK